MKIFLRIAGIIIAVLSLLLLFAVPVAGVIFLIIGAFFIILSIKLPQKPDKKPSQEKEDETPFSGRRTREPYYHKEDGEVKDIAKLCSDKPDNGSETIYIIDAWLKSDGELDVQKREICETVEEAKEQLKDMGYKPIKNDAHMEELRLVAYKEWFYK
ncbi:MAG: hypothetical protein LBV68_09095 [Spirochaetaceae bacterium]|jgi:hypothetical protein|nr:hypothetical protein [Spirochaetaceae bacterium]